MSVMRRKFCTFLVEVKSKGLLRVLRITLDRFVVVILAKLFDFPASWHPPTSMRSYRRVIAQVVNELHPSIVCEVGCGLGSILSRIVASRRIGYDISPGVLRAARLIRHGSIDFRVGSLDTVDISRMDVLILVNWIHEVSPAVLEQDLLPLLPRTQYLMLDAIDKDNDSGYLYKHDFGFLEELALLRSVTRVQGEGRSFMLYEVLA